MILRIDTTSSIPVYAQIVDQIKRAVASGTLKNGDGLPSLRETAIKLRINPLTVGKAYKLLESDGLIETKHGLGSFVTAAAEQMNDGFRREVLTQAVDNLLIDAYHLGVTFDELTEILEERMEAAHDDFKRDDFKRGDGADGK